MNPGTFDSPELLHAEIEGLTQGYISQMYETDLTESEVVDHLNACVPGYQQFVNSYVNNAGDMIFRDSKVQLKLDDVIDIEESIWSPVWGLKVMSRAPSGLKTHNYCIQHAYYKNISFHACQKCRVKSISTAKYLIRKIMTIVSRAFQDSQLNSKLAGGQTM